MGKKRRRRRRGSQPGGFWRQEYGGMPMWGIAGAVALLVVGAIAVAIALPQQVSADPNRAPRPVPSFSLGTQEDKPRAVFIGDSYTAGAGGGGTTWPTLVGNTEGWTVVNLGRGGTGYVTTAGPEGCGLEYCPSFGEMIPEAASENPDILVIAGGRNDADRVTPEAIANTLRAARDAMPDTRIIVLSPVWDDDQPPAFLANSVQWTREAATAVSAEYIDMGQPFLGHPEWMSEDGVHPNADGYRAFADALIAQLPG